MVGSWANCPPNLVRAHRMLKPRAQMALEKVGSFQYLMYCTASFGEQFNFMEDHRKLPQNCKFYIAN